MRTEVRMELIQRELELETKRLGSDNRVINRMFKIALFPVNMESLRTHSIKLEEVDRHEG